jgi:nucleotide-binding universal stress UspA family protein
MPGADHPDAGSGQRVKHRVSLNAGKPEDGVDAMPDQGLDDDVRGGTGGIHDAPRPVSASRLSSRAYPAARSARRPSADLRREAEKAAREQGIPITFVATRGDSFSELHRIAREICADAIVVGASTKAAHRLVGSLAVRLVRASKWPVTVVP